MFRSETEFVNWLRRHAPRAGGRVKLGIGDDAALVKVAQGNELILTSDLSIEDVHFRRDLHPPRSAGHRALARALSDVAAMGGQPRFALVSLALSQGTPRAWVEEFYEGVFGLARRFDVTVIGGDTAVFDGKITADLVLAGEVARGKALLRAGARPGDALYVSGWPGRSALGLELLRSGRAQAGGRPAASVTAHLYPQPRCGLGRFLAEHLLASAAIDISDGLALDASRLLEASGVGVRLWANRLPLPENPPGTDPELPLELALFGGEDYELLFTVPPRKVARLPRKVGGVSLTRIGEIRRRRGLTLVLPTGEEVSLAPRGYDHFTKKQD
jgi:thiamine-monophosphate kinase